MFLNRLTPLEKEAFISLGVNAAKANGEFVAEERAMIKEYCKEMEIPFFDAEDAKTADDIEAVFKSSTECHKKIALFELLGLMVADGSYDNMEEDFVLDFAKRIGLSENDVNILYEFLKKYLDLVKEISEDILR